MLSEAVSVDRERIEGIEKDVKGLSSFTLSEPTVPLYCHPEHRHLNKKSLFRTLETGQTEHYARMGVRSVSSLFSLSMPIYSRCLAVSLSTTDIEDRHLSILTMNFDSLRVRGRGLCGPDH